MARAGHAKGRDLRRSEAGASRVRAAERARRGAFGRCAGALGGARLRANIGAAALLAVPVLLASIAASPARAGELREVTARPGEPSGAGERWALYMYHLHTTEGQWAYREGDSARAGAALSPRRYDQVARALERVGVEVASVTEHNTFDHAPMLAARTGRPHLLAGVEYSSVRGGGHVGLVFPPGSTLPAIVPQDAHAVDRDDLARAIARAQAAGAHTIVNHPLIGSFPWPADDMLGADAIEVDSPAVALASFRRNVSLWHDRVTAERRAIVMLSGADYHAIAGLPLGPFRGWVNRVRIPADTAPDATGAAVFEALARGRTQIIRGTPWGSQSRFPTVLIGADLDGDGRFDDARAGEVVRGDAGRALTVQVRVLEGKGMTLALFDERSSRRPAWTGKIRSDDATFAFARSVPAAASFGLVRAEVRTLLGRPIVVTNPVYLATLAADPDRP